jgi:diguanylate cyclase (GGDEF)-like protein/PAS domain S-box-containing protein
MFSFLQIESFQFSPHAAPYFVSALVVATTGFLVYRWDRGSRTGSHFLAFSTLFAVWTLLRGALYLTRDAELATAISRYLYAFVALGLPLLLEFVFLVLRTTRLRRPLIRGSWTLGTVLAVASLSSTWMVDGVRELPWGFEPRQGMLGPALMLWVLLVIGVMTFDAFRAWRRALPDSVERRRLRLFCISLPILYAAAGDLLAGAGLPLYPLGFACVLVFTAIAAYITWRHGLAEVTAQFAAVEIADMVRGALLIVDDSGAIQFINNPTARLFGVRRRDVIGRPLRDVVGEVATIANLAALAQSGSEKEIVYFPPGAHAGRDLALSASAMRDRHGRALAYVCVARDITDHNRQLDRRSVSAMIDPLTALPGRGLFVALLDTTLRDRQARPEGDAYVVLVVGLDRLRVINEELGHATGDRVLVEVVQRLQDFVCEEAEGHARNAVARIGGDEFGLLLHGRWAAANATKLMARLEESLREPLRVHDHELYIGASVGAATCEQPSACGDEVLRRASIAMYRVKAQGGGGSQVFTSEEAVARRTRLEAELRRAVAENQFCVVYQPIIDLRSGGIEGFEALVRWRHPERGLVSPAEFIALAESVGLMGAIDSLVLERACTDLRRLQDESGCLQLSMNINQSTAALSDPAMARCVTALIERCVLDPRSVRLELLESTVVIDAVRQTLQQLRDFGIGICIDDFGTGYSSLSRVHEVPVTTLKIDRSFVRAMVDRESGRKIIGSIVAMAEALGLTVIAEGVTLAQQADGLRAMGCTHAQGYLYSPPLSLDDALALLRRERCAPQARGELCPA